MYHSILKDPSRTGQYIVTPECFRNDMLYLKTNGYTTVTIAELTAFSDGVGALPERPVLVTFDDGHLNTLTYALPVLEELDMRAVVFAVGSYARRYTDSPDPNPSYAYLSYPELSGLYESGRFEIGCHSYDMHSLSPRRGTAELPGESAKAYREAFTADTELFLSELKSECGLTPTAYAYPFGLIGKGSGEMLQKLGFRCTLTCREERSAVTFGEPDTLMGLGRFNRPGGVSTAEFMLRALGSAADPK